MKQCDILIETEFLPPSFWWEPENPIRGTDEFSQETAKILNERNFSVVVEKDPPYSTDKSRTGLILGAPRGTVKKPKIIISCNPVRPINRPYEKVVIWSSLYAVSANELRKSANVHPNTLVFGLSRFHLKQLKNNNSDNRLRLLPLGVHKEKYADNGSLRTKYSQKTGRRLALFSSSPDRGLDVVVRLAPAMAMLGVDLITSNYPQPGKINKPLTDRQMINLYKKAHYWLHPGIGNELFCLAAAKAQAAGCCPIVRARGALDETVKNGFKLTPNSSVKKWCDFVIKSISEPIPPIQTDHIKTWQQSTLMLIEAFKEA